MHIILTHAHEIVPVWRNLFLWFFQHWSHCVTLNFDRWDTASTRHRHSSLDTESWIRISRHLVIVVCGHCCRYCCLYFAERSTIKMGNEGEIVEIENSDDLKTKLQEAGSKLVVIDFFAVWCGPCKIIGPKIEELAKELQDVVFLKVDVDECEDIATEYDISSMPTFVFIKESKVLETFSGANYNRLRNTIEDHK